MWADKDIHIHTHTHLYRRERGQVRYRVYSQLNKTSEKCRLFARKPKSRKIYVLWMATRRINIGNIFSIDDMLKKHSSGYLAKLESILFIEPSFHENGPLLGLPFVMTILSNAISLIYFQWIHYCSTFYTLKHTISPTHLLVHSPVCSLIYSI